MYVKNYSNALEILFFFLLCGVLLFWATYPSIHTSKNTLLIKAVASGDTNKVAALLNAGANVDSVIGDDKRSPLIISVKTGHPDMAKFLMTRGANSNYKDANGKSAVDYARDSGWKNLSEIFSNR